ncbi:unnamed protein product, partial [Iphiclides podalirius]
MNGKFTEVAQGSDVEDAMERIVGGRNATCEEFPHQVSFVVNNSYFCGGFIISESYIMTAAHCAQDVDPSTVVMRIGSTWRKNGTTVTVAEVIPYPEYDNPPYDKDVAVMKLAEPLEFDACTQPIALPPKALSARYGEIMTVSGWGRTKGDSGGIGTIDNVARGIVSFGRGCGQPLAPSVFTDISAPEMRDFITKHTGL